MKFGPVRVTEAEGMLLAHATLLPSGRLPKGHKLTNEDVVALSAAGINEVTTAALNQTDVAENDAALRLAEILSGPSLTTGTPTTGRCNLFAAQDGLLTIDENIVQRVNAIDEAISMATLRSGALVQRGQLVSTVKIIPLALPEILLDQAATTVVAAPVNVIPFRPMQAALIQTRLPHTKPTILDKTAAATRHRLSRINAVIASDTVVDHHIQDVADVLRREAINKELIILIGASSIIDRRDVIPAALSLAGGTIDRFGLPVDPGNLTMVGRLGGAFVIALPGSARSPREHGTDWILAHIAADQSRVQQDYSKMGVGGLLKEMPRRPRPREWLEDESEAERNTRVTAIILSAGRSTRMGKANKLLTDIGGKPLVTRIVERVTASTIDHTIVVTGHERERIEQALSHLPVSFVHNSDFSEGLSTSLVRGLTALPSDVSGVLICLGDMPNISTGLIDQMVRHFNPAARQSLAVASYQGDWGNPVLWGQKYFAELRQLTGDRGARLLLERYADAAIEVEVDDKAAFIDLDTPEALAAFRLTAKQTGQHQ